MIPFEASDDWSSLSSFEHPWKSILMDNSVRDIFNDFMSDKARSMMVAESLISKRDVPVLLRIRINIYSKLYTYYDRLSAYVFSIFRWKRIETFLNDLQSLRRF